MIRKAYLSPLSRFALHLLLLLYCCFTAFWCVWSKFSLCLCSLFSFSVVCPTQTAAKVTRLDFLWAVSRSRVRFAKIQKAVKNVRNCLLAIPFRSGHRPDTFCTDKRTTIICLVTDLLKSRQAEKGQFFIAIVVVSLISVVLKETKQTHSNHANLCKDADRKDHHARRGAV